MARLNVGKCFSSYEDLLSQIAEYEKENLINVAKKHSRTIENAVKRGSAKIVRTNTHIAYFYLLCLVHVNNTHNAYFCLFTYICLLYLL